MLSYATEFVVLFVMQQKLTDTPPLCLLQPWKTVFFREIETVPGSSCDLSNLSRSSEGLRAFDKQHTRLLKLKNARLTLVYLW